MFFLQFKLTKNNLFIIIQNSNGKELIYVSCGSVGFSGPARATDYAAEQAGKQIGFKLKTKNINEVIFILKQKMHRNIRAALKGLYYFKIKIKKIIIVPKIAHNGVRLRKMKRK